jgi:hypothetical protein
MSLRNTSGGRLDGVTKNEDNVTKNDDNVAKNDDSVAKNDDSVAKNGALLSLHHVVAAHCQQWGEVSNQSESVCVLLISARVVFHTEPLVAGGVSGGLTDCGKGLFRPMVKASFGALSLGKGLYVCEVCVHCI